MKILLYLSEFIIPFFVFLVVGYGMLTKHKVYEDFIEGAKEGIRTVVSILPTLIGLMVGTSVLRASGLLDAISRGLGYIIGNSIIPTQVIPVIIVRLFSSSAATGLCLDLFETFGTDSHIGFMVSILMSCTETVFYTMSVYFMAAKVSKTRWTLSGALISTLAGVAASVFLSL
ncbi:MAG: spore maturation protein [Butyrivibrio sp.]